MEPKNKGKAVEVSADDRAKLASLTKDVQRLQLEAGAIIAKYLGRHEYRLVSRPDNQRQKLEFFNDDHGHCGVYDDAAGTCSSCDCVSISI